MADDQTAFTAGLAKTEYILTGHPYRTIIRLAWPATASMIARMILLITDAVWVGRLGAEPMAALISSIFVIWIAWSLMDVVTSGAVALLARALGARDIARAGYVADHIFRFSVWIGAAIMIIGMFTAHWGLRVMDVAPEVGGIGRDYLRVFFSAWIVVMFWELFGALYRASGDTRTPFLIGVSSVILNVILDPLFIFGIGPFPRLGVMGAALATAMSFGFAVALYFVAFRRRPLPFAFPRHYFARPDWAVILRTVRVGLPISLAGVVFAVVYLFVNRVTASFGTAAVAALGIGNRIESINYMVAYGFSMAVATLVGQNLGAKNPRRAESLVFKTVLVVSLFCGITSILFFVFALPIARFFTSDPAVWPLTVTYLQILALSQIHMAWEIVFEGAFTGAGDTVPPMIVSIVGAVVRVPLAYALAVWWGVGIAGIWWTMTLTTLAKGTVMLFWFRLGRWKKKEV